MKTNQVISTSNGTRNGQAVNFKDLLLPEAIRETQNDNPGYNKLTPTEVYLRSSAYDDGYELAIKSNDFRPNSETEEKLRQKWQKVAKESNQGVFDPVINLHDKHYQEEFERLQKNRRKDAEDALQNAEINLREKEEILAQTSKPAAESSVVLWVIFAVAVIVFSIGFAPTFHDVFFITLAQSDPLLGWLISILFSIPIGAILALLILVEFGRKIASFNWLGLTAGILVAFGFLLIRMSASDGLDSLSLGLLIFEVAIVLGLEACCYFRRKAKKEDDEKSEIYETAEKDLDVAVKQKERSKQEYEIINDAIKAHIEYIKQRINGTIFNPAIEEALISASLSGYHSGIRDNHGRKIGRKEKRNER